MSRWTRRRSGRTRPKKEAWRALVPAFQHRETLLRASSDEHSIRYPTDSETVGCSCGWTTDVPLGHSLTDAYIDQHYGRLPDSELRLPPAPTCDLPFGDGYTCDLPRGHV